MSLQLLDSWIRDIDGRIREPMHNSSTWSKIYAGGPHQDRCAPDL